VTSSEEQVRAAIARQAADWFIANQGGTLGHADCAAFVAWLKASPVHVEEYLGVALVARDLPAAADDPEVPLEPLLELARADAVANVVSVDPTMPRREPPARRLTARRTWPLAGAAAAAASLLAASVLWWTNTGQLRSPPQTYRTEHGEQSVRRLPDGSVLHLNTDTAVTVSYRRTERVLDIDRGEALFQVVHDDRRPFRVVAGVAEIVAVGTRFDVRRAGDTTLVTVVDGQVLAFTREHGRRTGGSARPPDARRIDAGYRLRIDGGIMEAQPERVDTRHIVAWLQRKIVFARRPLGEVADEFNRYGHVPLTIDDAALRALPVSGVFDAYDTNSFAAFLETLDGVHVERTPTRIRVVMPKHTNTKDDPVVH